MHSFAHGSRTKLSAVDSSWFETRRQASFHCGRQAASILASVTEARVPHRTEDEIQAREVLMRLQFERDAEAWKNAVPLETVLAKLESIIESKK
jgi:hypothetical protein